MNWKYLSKCIEFLKLIIHVCSLVWYVWAVPQYTYIYIYKYIYIYIYIIYIYIYIYIVHIQLTSPIWLCIFMSRQYIGKPLGEPRYNSTSKNTQPCWLVNHLIRYYVYNFFLLTLIKSLFFFIPTKPLDFVWFLEICGIVSIPVKTGLFIQDCDWLLGACVTSVFPPFSNMHVYAYMYLQTFLHLSLDKINHSGELHLVL